MATNGTPPPTWPVEPTNWFVVLYYPNNATNTAPTITQTVMKDYGLALEAAKRLITDNNNEGVCAISQVTGTIVYPSIPWVDF